MKQWYEELFKNYGVKYDNESFTMGTIGECDFIETDINYNKSTIILLFFLENIYNCFFYTHDSYD